MSSGYHRPDRRDRYSSGHVHSSTEEQQYNMHFEDDEYSDMERGRGGGRVVSGHHGNRVSSHHDIAHSHHHSNSPQCYDTGGYDLEHGRHGNAAGRHDDETSYSGDERGRYDDEGDGRYDDRVWVPAASQHVYDSELDDHVPREHVDARSLPSARNAPSAQMASGAGSDYTTVDDTVKTKTSRHGNVMVETMSAPHPCCPNTKGVCCLMLLLNLSLILVSLGFVIVLQLFRPPFVWYIGIVLLIAGFASLIFCVVYCVWVCGDRRYYGDRAWSQPQQLYWTHHWRKQWPYNNDKHVQHSPPPPPPH